MVTAHSSLEMGVHLLIAQIYVNKIVFGATVDPHAHEFAKEMKKEFEMIMNEELAHFSDLQVKQSDEGMFISQSKYA